jgi:hypothetical protein
MPPILRRVTALHPQPITVNNAFTLMLSFRGRAQGICSAAASCAYRKRVTHHSEGNRPLHSSFSRQLESYDIDNSATLPDVDGCADLLYSSVCAE